MVCSFPVIRSMSILIQKLRVWPSVTGLDEPLHWCNIYCGGFSSNSDHCAVLHLPFCMSETEGCVSGESASHDQWMSKVLDGVSEIDLETCWFVLQVCCIGRDQVLLPAYAAHVARVRFDKPLGFHHTLHHTMHTTCIAPLKAPASNQEYPSAPGQAVGKL